ncbi:MAG: hypothetical protein HDT48_05275 [Ruminococcaceae bacterium]|nr:hypothetical protein [Oscillospiraceae bacterium]
MQRKPFWKLLILGIGYMVLGNVMSTVMTVALSMFGDVPAVMGILFVFTLFVFYALIFTVAFKDGQREMHMVKNHRVDGPIKGRWIAIGVIMFLVMCIPSVILFFDATYRLFDGFLIPYRMICGMIYPLALTMGVNYSEITEMPSYIAFIFMACYILIPVVAAFGFDVGFKDKFNPDKIMYEKKK